MVTLKVAILQDNSNCSQKAKQILNKVLGLWSNEKRKMLSNLVLL